jgi:hypothetical protein
MMHVTTVITIACVVGMKVIVVVFPTATFIVLIVSARTPTLSHQHQITAVGHAGSPRMLQTVSVMTKTTTVDVIGTAVIVAAKVTITRTVMNRTLTLQVM